MWCVDWLMLSLRITYGCGERAIHEDEKMACIIVIFGFVLGIAGPSLLNHFILPKIRRGLARPITRKGEISGHWVGVVERIAIGPIVWLAPTDVFSVIGGWMAMKIAATWNDPIDYGSSTTSSGDQKNTGNDTIAHRMASLLGSLISMAGCYYGTRVILYGAEMFLLA